MCIRDRYWGWQYTPAEGKQAGAEWLVGYPLGAAAARSEGDAYEVASLNIPSRRQYLTQPNLNPPVGLPGPASPGPDTIDGTIDFVPITPDITDPPVKKVQDAAGPDSSDASVSLQPPQPMESRFTPFPKVATKQAATAQEMDPAASAPEPQPAVQAPKPRINPVVSPKIETKPAVVPQPVDALPELNLKKNDAVYGFGIN